MWLQVRVSRNYQKSKQLTPRSTDVKQTQGKRITIADRKRSLQESGTQGKPRGKPRTKRYHTTTLLMWYVYYFTTYARSPDLPNLPPRTAKPTAKPAAPDGEQEEVVAQEKMYVYLLNHKLVYMVY